MVSSSATTVQQYINELESEKAKVIRYVRKLILESLPKGIKETMDWGMINYELPLSTYPKTYNTQRRPKTTPRRPKTATRPF